MTSSSLGRPADPQSSGRIPYSIQVDFRASPREVQPFVTVTDRKPCKPPPAHENCSLLRAVFEACFWRRVHEVGHARIKGTNSHDDASTEILLAIHEARPYLFPAFGRRAASRRHCCNCLIGQFLCMWTQVAVVLCRRVLSVSAIVIEIAATCKVERFPRLPMYALRRLRKCKEGVGSISSLRGVLNQS
jgi:hypothetical protein